MDNLTHQYNGKEQQDKAFAGGVKSDWYDYGARFYDPTLGRWHTIDPLAEKYYPINPYAYVANNPLIYIDPDGRDMSPYYDQETGAFLGVDENGFKGEIMVTTKEAYNKADKNHDGSVNSQSIKSDNNTRNFQDGEVLGAKVYSNIYTHILKEGGYDISKLSETAVSIKTSTDSYNSPSPNVRYQITTGIGKAKFKISVNQSSIDAKIELTTVENILNSLGAHEFMGHGVQGFSNEKLTHYKAFENQINDKTWSNTTQIFKLRMIKRYAQYLQKENPSRYRAKYPEIIKYWEK